MHSSPSQFDRRRLVRDEEDAKAAEEDDVDGFELLKEE